jgi:hypothetical protein
MSRLYGDQLQSSGRRYYFALDSAPGIVTPAQAIITLEGRVPLAQQPNAVFRTPTPALLTIQGQSLASPTNLSPASATITTGGQIPALVRQLTITPATPAPDYSTPPSLTPALVTIWQTQPGVGSAQLQTLELNVTQGGNIGFVSPGAAQLSIVPQAITLLVLSGGVQPGLVTIVGLEPTLLHSLTITPDVGQVVAAGQAHLLSLPFIWIDDDPAPPSSWITDAAA